MKGRGGWIVEKLDGSVCVCVTAVFIKLGENKILKNYLSSKIVLSCFFFLQEYVLSEI